MNNTMTFTTLRRKADLLVRTGVLLMECGADTSRIMRTMTRLSVHFGIPHENLHIDVRWSLVAVNISDATHSVYKSQKVRRHRIDMNTMAVVSKLSWRAISHNYDVEHYAAHLKDIERGIGGTYAPWLLCLCAAIACAGFCRIFGGGWEAAAITAMAAIPGYIVRRWLNTTSINVYVVIATAAAVSTCCAAILMALIEWDTGGYPLCACTLFIIPGVPLINFVSDMLDDHLMVGVSRAVNTIMIVAAMSFGIAMALRVILPTMPDAIDRIMAQSISGGTSYAAAALAGAMGAAGFASIFNIPRRALWVVAIGGATTVSIRTFAASTLGMGPALGAFVAAAVIAVIAIKVVHIVHVPMNVITVPSVIVMVPGVLMYRALMTIIYMHGVVGELTQAVYNGVQSALIILCIALGVAVPTIFARRHINRRRQQRVEALARAARRRNPFIEEQQH